LDPPEFPSDNSKVNSEAEFEAEDLQDNPDEIEPGDRVFMTTVHDPVEFIQATATTSQRLAEAFTQNSAPPKSFCESVPSQFHDCEDVFSKVSFNALPDCKPWDHAIELEFRAKASSTKVYPLSPNEQTELDAFIEENFVSGQICPSKSPMTALVFFIKKKDGSLWLVQDYRALNAKMVKNAYPLPLISDLINRLWGARYFTKLDVWWGYNNVHIKEGDEQKAAFHINWGLFEPLVMFFGVTNSPATFQTMMNKIFQDLISKGVVCIYLDDILIFTETMEEHDQVTRLVLEQLWQYKLYLRHDKCEFIKTKIEYLRLIISHGQAEMDLLKIAGVAEWPTTSNKKEVQSFLCFTNFYCHFIQGFSDLTCPMFDLTRKDFAWQWWEAEKSAFEAIQTHVISAPILVFLDDRRTLLRTLHQNSGDPRESLSKHRSGQSMMGSSVSRTESMCLMIQSCTATSWLSTMTPE
jgi:Reverse transcriptase (RNA-dependent DNA polymerase)